jgi:hypothetical protein
LLTSGASAFLSFAAFVAPGALWSWLSERRRSVRARSQVLEAAYVTMWSVLFTAPAVAVVGAAIVAADWTAAFDRLVTPSAKNPIRVRDLAAVASAIGATLAVSMALTIIVFRCLADRVYGKQRLLLHSGWTRTFRPSGDMVPLAELHLNDGTTINGIIDTFADEHDFDKREILLQHPIHGTTPTGQPLWPDGAPQRLVLAHHAIAYIGVHFIQQDLAIQRGHIT